ncbi:hypothetical protein COCCADRAFT_112587 [Bipolaris zeicola 26-R-13]|uniref:Uncharacterized protein n=1 Tax=Cochliobolus carbonum (strain 26-R-13) TaxID=930089 RepID=W6XNL6_COCC2|nr:uncharacterized protein COCCADRAFT_112587 [Bipolaris zeicola 26-R-13]EUC27093.1 hypothetical protein COCCADRAFT_112587 [Bipolaris zeicola 26-R-13]
MPCSPQSSSALLQQLRQYYDHDAAHGVLTSLEEGLAHLLLRSSGVRRCQWVYTCR